MHKPKKRTLNSPRKKAVDWLQYIDDCLPGLVIPVGPRFQAQVPEWSEPSDEGNLPNGSSESLKWLGTRIWPPEDSNTVATKEHNIGKGRPDSCSCSTPDSPQCVKLHTSQERTRLQSELGPAFKSWKFDVMGEDVGKSWTSRQKKRFEFLVKTNPLSQGQSFLKPAEVSFVSKTRDDIVNYYLNVYVPRRISMITRAGCKVLDSDDDEVEEAPKANNDSLKRARPPGVDSTKLAKSHYLIGRR